MTMRLRKSKDTRLAAAAEPAAQKPTAAAAETAKWTNGSALGSKALGFVVIGCLIAGPVGLVYSVASSGRPAQSAPAPVEVTLSPLQQAAGAFAVGYVGTWLSATQNDSEALKTYIDTASTTLSDKPFEYRNAAVASVAAQPDSDLVTAVVAADVRDAVLTNSGEKDTWPRRYFRVTVNAANNALAAVGFPAPIAGPDSSTDAPPLAYRATVASSDGAGKSVVSFLTAYLTGQGSVQPYTSPTVTISPITPAPYSALTPVSIVASAQPSNEPADGTSVSVLATVTAQNVIGQKVSGTYAMELTARAGRWEISSLEATPLLASPSTSAPKTTPTPAPTGAGETEGK
jgi:hypothetical protein